MSYFELINELNDKYIEASEDLVEGAINGYNLPIRNCTKYLNIAKRVEKALISVILACKEYDNDSIVISHDDIGRNTMLTSTKTGETIIVSFIVGKED